MIEAASMGRIAEICDLVYRKFGIYISGEKQENFILKLEKVLRKENLSGTDELYSRLMSNDTRVIASFIEAITTSHTFFFREPAHLAKLVSYISDAKLRNFRIWCAASSSGEEPYSIVMTLLDAGINDFHLIASDLNKTVLNQFNRGEYNVNRLEGVSPETKRKYFKKINESTYGVRNDLRRFIAIKNLNLMDAFTFPEQVDFVFCRNVLIYFDEASRMRAVENITRNLKRGGKLFIGHAETLLFHPENLIKIANSVYERN